MIRQAIRAFDALTGRESGATPSVGAASVQDGGFSGSAPQGVPLPFAPNFLSGLTGAGTSIDKNFQNAFVDVYLSQVQLEIIYRVSWAAAKMIDIPVDDMFITGRSWTGDDEKKIEVMEEAEEKIGLQAALAMAMKAGRLYGSGALIVLSQDRPSEQELIPEMVSEGSVANLMVVDRWSMAIDSWHIDPLKPDYGKPFMYRVSPRLTQGETPQMHVHHSRVLRFEGKRPPLSEGWNNWDRDWGVSELAAAINQMGRDEHMHTALSHLLQEASVMVVKVQGFKQALQGRPDLDDPPLTELASGINALKSVFRTAFTDREDEMDRLQVSFGGIAQIIDSQSQRLAAIADIPMTRFFGQSPAGLNATGDSDMQNYAIRVAALQKKVLTAPLKKLDMILARHAGIKDDKPPEYEWRPLLSMSPLEQAEATHKNTQSVTAAVQAGLLTEDEARERLSQEPLFGELGPVNDETLKRLRRIAEGPPSANEGDEGGDGEKGGDKPGQKPGQKPPFGGKSTSRSAGSKSSKSGSGEES